MKRSNSVFLFSTTLLLGSPQIFAGVISSADIPLNQNLTSGSTDSSLISRTIKAKRLIIAETEISDQMDPRTQAPSTMGTAAEDAKKTVPDTKKTGTEAKTTSDTKKTGTEAKTTSDAKKTESEGNTTPDAKKTGSEGNTTLDAKKSTSAVKTAPATQPPAPVVKAAPATQPPAPAVKTAPATQPPAPAVKTAPATQPPVPAVKAVPATQPPVPAVKAAPATQPPSPAVKTAPATGMGVPLPNARPRVSANPLHENCAPFDPGHLVVVRAGHHWAVVGNTRLLHFSHRRSARRALTVLQYYGMNQQCFVGSPRPLFRYYLANSRAPSAPRLRGEHCVAFSPALIHIRRARNGRWVLAEGRRHIFRFKYDRREASKALSILRKYTFNHACYVGHGSHAMRYILQR